MADTNIHRWSSLAESVEPPSWTKRNELIGSLIPDNVSVLDIGCGNGDLKRFIPPNVKYCGLDCVGIPCDHKIILDFNMTNVYDLSLPIKYDYIICSGVLEYIQNPNTFIRFISQNGKNIILSYALHENRPIIEYSHLNGWVNDLPRRLLMDIFADHCLSPIIETKFENQTVFVLTSA